MTNVALIACILVLSMIVVGAIVARYLEKKDFNKGICPKCNNKLKHFDSDSDGNRGYTCPNCDYTTWCSYNVDKNYTCEENE